MDSLVHSLWEFDSTLQISNVAKLKRLKKKQLRTIEKR